ncbi:redox-regulated ATPase YchF [bacterium]|jgi:ribosome-binding ATPase|nr:redox-regulated ATPase YchF [bacterium]MBT6832354.1 redox-regulated ATPase YchF [bacterium]MBT6996449.1 redox-regulated ATPase YchF [bacterium]MBT7772760.1 redox-regulated ATPase YchF [bacterium]
MNLKIGIVGLPNVGKSTLFNALTGAKNAAAENFPFCTIDPNIGIVNVPDARLGKLAEIVSPERVMPAAIEFVDIAGLVAGASQGEGLGNKFLSHIRECQAIAHVLRDFEDSDVHHVSARVNPGEDFEIILTELVLADLESVLKQLDRVTKKARSGEKEAKAELAVLEQVKPILESGNLARELEKNLNEDELKILKQAHLLTNKKFLIVANTSEENFVNWDESRFREKLGEKFSKIPVVPICARTEAELSELDPAERIEFLSELGAEKSGLESLTQKSFELLGLQTYFTAGPKEVRAWTIRIGDTAPQAAGAIHTDFEKGFIKADTIAYSDFTENNGEPGARDAGKLRQEGKSYIVQNGDVMHFKFNV